MPELRGVGAQEAPPHRQVVEEVAHLDHRARGAAGLAHGHDLAAVDVHLGAGRRVRLAGEEAEARDRRDAREGLPAETQRADRADVRRVVNLARGVPLEAEQGVVAAHPVAVVAHAHEALAAAAEVYAEPAGAGIEGVLNQLLEDGGGALDDLPGRDLVRDDIGEDADPVHPGSMMPGRKKGKASTATRKAGV